MQISSWEAYQAYLLDIPFGAFDRQRTDLQWYIWKFTLIKHCCVPILRWVGITDLRSQILDSIWFGDNNLAMNIWIMTHHGTWKICQQVCSIGLSLFGWRPERRHHTSDTFGGGRWDWQGWHMVEENYCWNCDLLNVACPWVVQMPHLEAGCLCCGLLTSFWIDVYPV